MSVTFVLPQLEELARELVTLERDDLEAVISHVRDDNYSRDVLKNELLENNLRYFANKLVSGYYDQNRENYILHLEELGEEIPTVDSEAEEQQPGESTAPEQPEGSTEPAPDEAPAEQPAEESGEETSDEEANIRSQKEARLLELYKIGDLPPTEMDERETLEKELGVTDAAAFIEDMEKQAE